MSVTPELIATLLERGGSLEVKPDGTVKITVRSPDGSSSAARMRRLREKQRVTPVTPVTPVTQCDGSDEEVAMTTVSTVTHEPLEPPPLPDEAPSRPDIPSLRTATSWAREMGFADSVAAEWVKLMEGRSWQRKEGDSWKGLLYVFGARQAA